jgi:hypothetical protein
VELRLLNATTAVLYGVTAGLVVYFRLGPVRRVLARVARDGAEIPAWMPAGFTIVTVLFVGFLVFQGARHLRRAFPSGRGGPPPPGGD